jgi:hypothetical protein
MLNGAARVGTCNNGSWGYNNTTECKRVCSSPSLYGVTSWSATTNGFYDGINVSVSGYSSGITDGTIEAHCVSGTVKYKGCMRFTATNLTYSGVQIPTGHILEIGVKGAYGGGVYPGEGGYVYGKINNTGTVKLDIYPGAGGIYLGAGGSSAGGASDFGCNGGGSRSDENYLGGTGGACSAVMLNGDKALIAGGGGGGDCSWRQAPDAFGGNPNAGGSSSGMVGETGTNCNLPGGGGGYSGGKAANVGSTRGTTGGTSYIDSSLFDSTSSTAGSKYGYKTSNSHGYMDVCLSF